MSKIHEIYNTLCEKKVKTEEKIKEKPIVYVAGAFLGGLVISYIVARKPRITT